TTPSLPGAMTFSTRSELLSNSIGALSRFFTLILIGRLAGALIWLGWKRWSLTEIATLALCCALVCALANRTAAPTSVNAQKFFHRPHRSRRQIITFHELLKIIEPLH